MTKLCEILGQHDAKLQLTEVEELDVCAEAWFCQSGHIYPYRLINAVKGI